MVRQIIKGFTMLMIVVALSLVTAVASAYGQSSRHAIAKIPFEFIVGDRNLSAGEYDVRGMTDDNQVLAIRSTEEAQSALRLTSTITCASAPNKSKLVFRHYQNQYFLTEVWTAGERTGRQLMKSKQQKAVERELAANPSKSELAQNQYAIVEIVAINR